jgi:ubiquinol-cytochrome c reductase iron-sulfur subunit
MTKLVTQQTRSFGLMQEYNERKNKKLTGNFYLNEEPKFWVTSSRPSNFGDHLDVKTKADNWFDDNRLWNEATKDYEIKRAQIYMLQGVVLSSYVLGIKLVAQVVYNQMITRTRYIRDSYKEIDVTELPPGEVMQTSWNGELIFVRRLTPSEVTEHEAATPDQLLDNESKPFLSVATAGNSTMLVCSAVCTHLGCIPVPYLGAWKGWVCLCHGSVFDKYGRVRQGPALRNLPGINNTEHSGILCIEEMVFPNEPATNFYV